MADEDDIDAKIRVAQQFDKDARLARDKAEKTKLFTEHPEWFTTSFVMEFFPRLPPNVGGCIVCRMPTSAEQLRFRESTIGQPPTTKARAYMDLLGACRVYPESEAYRAMLVASPAVADEAAGALANAALGKEKEAGKG